MKVQYFNTFGHSKTKNKRKVHTITGLTQETRTSPNKQERINTYIHN